ncbi:MAG: cytochrome c oxidase subunit II [Actinomycetota bacterium]|nr:cytochrome c oxidase subunit II [Actinomycetota bacterium]
MTEQTRPTERTPVVQMLVIGAVASALGIALGLAIDWFPVSASSQAGPIDTLWDVLVIASVPIFVLVCTVVGFSMWKFRMRPGEESLDGPPIHGNTRLEIVWTALPAILLVALCSYAWVVLRDIEAAEANEMRVNVVGQQFTWTFEYPQPGGKPVKSMQLYLPKDRPVRFYVRAKDVIHDFWVPAFRMKIDAVPGITTQYSVTPVKLGDFPVVCAELCGLGHAFMRVTSHVVAPATFAAWLRKQQAPAQATGGQAPDGKKLFSDGNGDATACGSCHTLADAGTTATTGPNLDKDLKGKDAAFIRASIVKPDAQIAKGFQRGVMPPNYGDTLSAQELDALVKYVAGTAGK